jgi:hypothetical protein
MFLTGGPGFVHPLHCDLQVLTFTFNRVCFHLWTYGVNDFNMRGVIIVFVTLVI